VDSHTEAETGGSTSETETESESESETTGTTAQLFIPADDLATCFGCDPFAQDCPEGEKCVPYSSSGGNWDDSKCVPVLGEQTVGDSCTYAGTLESTDDCDATSFCFGVEDVDGELIGNCHSFCKGSADMPECPEGFTCPIMNAGSINLCVQACDPITQDCFNGEGCYWGDSSFSCVSTQGPGIADGEPCSYINDCTPSSMCTTAEVLPACNGAACCSPFCNLELGDVQCEARPRTMCLPLFEQGMAPLGEDQLGVCILAS
jgi:hypothetical protein